MQLSWHWVRLGYVNRTAKVNRRQFSVFKAKICEVGICMPRCHCIPLGAVVVQTVKALGYWMTDYPVNSQHVETVKPLLQGHCIVADPAL